MKRTYFLILTALFATSFLGGVKSALASEMKIIQLKIKNATFSPEIVEVPAGEKFKLEVENLGPGAEEFESVELNREKVIAPGKTVTIFLGPLAKGEYQFFGDFHKDTAKGKLVAKDPVKEPAK